MAPRKYEMTRRAEATEATRRRIVEAAVQLHGEQGFVGTTMQDIAARADVALGTLYRYFRNPDDVLGACSAHVAAMVPPPGPHVLEGVPPGRRIETAVRELFGYYDRAHPWMITTYDEAPKSPALAAFVPTLDRIAVDLLSATLTPEMVAGDVMQRVLGMLDFYTWRGLTRRGMTSDAAARFVAPIIRRELAAGRKERP